MNGFKERVLGAIGATQAILAVTVAFALWICLTQGIGVIAESVVIGVMWTLVALGVSMVYGVMRVPNFAAGEIFMVGTLASYYAFGLLHSLGLPSLVTWLLCVVSGTVAGLAVGYVINASVMVPLRRYSKDFMSDAFVATAALSVVLVNLHYLVFGATFKGIERFFDLPPVTVLGTSMSVDRVVALCTGVVVIGAISWGLHSLPVGRQMRAVADTPTGALLVGINVGRIRALSFMLSSAVGALAGATMLFMFPSSPYVGIVPLELGWTIMIVSGLGNIGACLWGGLIVGLFQTGAAAAWGHSWADVVPLALVIVVLVFKPLGLFGRAATRA